MGRLVSVIWRQERVLGRVEERGALVQTGRAHTPILASFPQQNRRWEGKWAPDSPVGKIGFAVCTGYCSGAQVRLLFLLHASRLLHALALCPCRPATHVSPRSSALVAFPVWPVDDSSPFFTRATGFCASSRQQADPCWRLLLPCRCLETFHRHAACLDGGNPVPAVRAAHTVRSAPSAVASCVDVCVGAESALPISTIPLSTLVCLPGLGLSLHLHSLTTTGAHLFAWGPTQPVTCLTLGTVSAVGQSLVLLGALPPRFFAGQSSGTIASQPAQVGEGHATPYQSRANMQLLHRRIQLHHVVWAKKQF